jgi:hypothetical protein
VSEADTAIPEPGDADQAANAAKRFNVLVVLIALGTLGVVLFWVYKAIANIRKAADEAGVAFGARSRRRAIAG